VELFEVLSFLSKSSLFLLVLSLRVSLSAEELNNLLVILSSIFFVSFRAIESSIFFSIFYSKEAEFLSSATEILVFEGVTVEESKISVKCVLSSFFLWLEMLLELLSTSEFESSFFDRSKIFKSSFVSSFSIFLTLLLCKISPIVSVFLCVSLSLISSAFSFAAYVAAAMTSALFLATLMSSTSFSSFFYWSILSAMSTAAVSLTMITDYLFLCLIST